MYNVRGPSKIVAKSTRRGISQNMDNIRDYNRNKSIENDDCEIINGPKPVFHRKTAPNHHRHEVISPQHEEIIKYINESWNSVCSEVYNDNNNTKTANSSIFYKDEPCSSLQNFKPFDLESWWGKRLYAYVTGSVNGVKIN